MNSSNKYVSRLYSYFQSGAFHISDEEIEKYINKIPKTKINFSNYGGEFVKDGDGETILFQACLYKRPQSLNTIKLLLAKGANPNIVSKEEDKTPLMIAISSWTYTDEPERIDEIVDELLKPEHNVDIGYTDENGYNALYYACYAHRPQIAIKLLNTGLSNPCPDFVGDYNGGRDVFLIACENKMEDVALRLIELCPHLTNKKHYVGINNADIRMYKTSYELALDNGLTRVAQVLNPLANIIRGIESDIKKPFNDPESVYMLKDYLDGGNTARETRVSLGGKNKRKNRKTQKLRKNRNT